MTSERSRTQELFRSLFFSKNEGDVDACFQRFPELESKENWHPLGGNDSNFGIVENQQSNPVAAIVEKLTNSIDAILMRKCLEAGINPRSPEAPRSIEQAVNRFFPDHKNWDLSSARNDQGQSIQILADSYPGKTSDTSLIIYDDGEGQHPEQFEDTFLSLIAGNKNEIHFVHGKYNMGGSGAINFCGKRRYQLIASRRYDESGDFGFTLIRKHPLTEQESLTKKSTWYEYFKLCGKIPSFSFDEMDLGLNNRNFRTGTILKLYSYELKGNRHIRRDLSRSLNEFLYSPALPISIIETKERYPNDRALETVIYGLKRQLSDENEYIESTFSEIYTDKEVGETKVTVHVFKPRAAGKNPSDTRKYIRNEYFKNGMAVLFALNGQVHAHYTSEFITRSLKFNLLRDFLLIHVDCSDMNLEFRQELFMASRDRLKGGEESGILRDLLRNNLSKGRLKDIYKRRKDSISTDTAEDEDLLRNLAENLPIDDDLRRLVDQTFKLDKRDKPETRHRANERAEGKKQYEPPLFNPRRYPTFFKLDAKADGGQPVIKIPLGGERTLSFDTDVENEYFDRVDDAGDLKMGILKYVPNENKGGNQKGSVNEIGESFFVNRSSPNDGKIRVVLKPTENMLVGDEIEIRANLASPEADLEAVFWVKITEPKPKQKGQAATKTEPEKIGLPKYVRVHKDDPNSQGLKTWEDLEDIGIEMDFDTVMYPFLEGDKLDTVFINMDSGVLKSFMSQTKNPSEEQIRLTRLRYVSAVYFHTLFLYLINQKRGYLISQERNDSSEEVDLAAYLQDLFSSHYAAFLLRFGTGELIDAL